MHGEASTDGFIEECTAIRAQAGTDTQAVVAELVRLHAQALADTFYTRMFEVSQAASLLDRSTVNDRLRHSMARWLVQLFDGTTAPATLAQAQRRTGEVHARIGVPPMLVSRGARVLTRAIVAHLATRGGRRQDAVHAAQYVYELFTLAVDTMVTTYALNSNRLARSDEAFRLFFLGQDMKAERERRRSELLEWAQHILERYYWSEGPAIANATQDSTFSLWLDHKASILFDGAPELASIRTLIARVELELLPRLQQVRSSHHDARAVVGEIHACVDQTKSLLGTMFDRYLAIEDGRDSVTTLLNRRYFPAIAKREIHIAEANHSSFAVLMVAIDQFNDLIGTWGLERGEQVLTRVAQLLQDAVRAGDFVFRIGEADFLLLLVEANQAAARLVADGLRKQAEASPMKLSPEVEIRVTIGIGGAVFDGHPDYQRLLERADAALRRAQSTGLRGCEFED